MATPELPEAKTLAEVAYEQLRADILSGQLQPNQRLKFASLVSRYRIGVSPLREALARLSADYLVKLEGQRGFTVAPATVEDLMDISRMRQMVEGEATELSIRNGDLYWESAIVSAFYRLQRIEDARDPASATWAQEWEACNRAFHHALIAQCDSPWLLRLHGLLLAQHSRYRFLSLQQVQEPRDLNAEHKVMMEACLNRDVALARQLTSEHIEKTAQALSPLLPTVQAPDRPQRRKPEKGKRSEVSAELT